MLAIITLYAMLMNSLPIDSLSSGKSYSIKVVDYVEYNLVELPSISVRPYRNMESYRVSLHIPKRVKQLKTCENGGTVFLYEGYNLIYVEQFYADIHQEPCRRIKVYDIHKCNTEEALTCFSKCGFNDLFKYDRDVIPLGYSVYFIRGDVGLVYVITNCAKKKRILRTLYSGFDYFSRNEEIIINGEELLP